MDPGGEIERSLQRPHPPGARPASLLRRAEPIVVQGRTDVLGRRPGERIGPIKATTSGVPARSPSARLPSQPRSAPRPERREPELPVQPGMEGCHEARAPHRIPGLIAESVRLPVRAVPASLEHQLRPLGGHHPKQAVAIDRAERLDPSHHLVPPAGPPCGAAPVGSVKATSRTRLNALSPSRTGVTTLSQREAPRGFPGLRVLPHERRVAQCGKAEHQREQVEEAVVARGRDPDLQRRDRQQAASRAGGTGWEQQQPGSARFYGERPPGQRMVHPRRPMVRVPGGPRRQGLGLEVEVEGRALPPGGVTAQDLGNPGQEHQLEQEEHEQ